MKNMPKRHLCINKKRDLHIHKIIIYIIDRYKIIISIKKIKLYNTRMLVFFFFLFPIILKSTNVTF